MRWAINYFHAKIVRIPLPNSNFIFPQAWLHHILSVIFTIFFRNNHKKPSKNKRKINLHTSTFVPKKNGPQRRAKFVTALLNCLGRQSTSRYFSLKEPYMGKCQLLKTKLPLENINSRSTENIKNRRLRLYFQSKGVQIKKISG